MRSRYKNQLIVSALIASMVYILYLGVQGQLSLYIHPRYNLFTIAMTVVGLAITILSSYYSAKGKDHSHAPGSHQESKLLYLPLIVLITAALFLPAQSLSSATVSQRRVDTGSLVSTTESEPLSTLFAGSSKGLKLADWSRLLAANTDPSFYTKKPAKISGFIYDAGLGSDTVWLARFVVTCCAVDAQPIGIPVHIQDWENTYQQDQWVEVEGEFSLESTAEGEQIVLIPSDEKPIEQPDNPYAN